MHGQDFGFGHEVVHQGEDGLLDFPGIFGPADDHQPFGQVQDDERLAVDAVVFGVAVETGNRDHSKIGPVGLQFLIRGPNKQLVGEQVLGGPLVDDADAEAVVGVGADEAVEDVEVPALDVGADPAVEAIEVFLGDGNVEFAPVDFVVFARFIDDEFVVGRPAGVFASFDAEGAVGG